MCYEILVVIGRNHANYWKPTLKLVGTHWFLYTPHIVGGGREGP